MPPAKKAAANADDANPSSSARDKPSTSSAPASRKPRNNGTTASHAADPNSLNGASKNHPPAPSSFTPDAAASATAAALAAGLTPGSAANGLSPGSGMAWQTAPLSLLETYRVAYNLPSPSAFTSPLTQARLTNPGLGRQSPTMARRKEKRRIGKEQLALAVRKNFNAAAVSEIDVVVDLIYKVRNQDNAFRMRLNPGVAKKSG